MRQEMFLKENVSCFLLPGIRRKTPAEVLFYLKKSNKIQYVLEYVKQKSYGQNEDYWI